jgi:hypothetical protein
MLAMLRESAGMIEREGTPSQVGPSPTFLRDVANELERLSLFERYAGRMVEGLVEDAIAHKARHGKYPFED